MHWTDRVYGDVSIDDPDVLALIATPTFQRLRGIRQAGPSAIAFPFKTVTRYEHSLGVYLLLKRLGVARQEQVAGLLHDISHTAFSHAVDFVFASEEQDHHERLKPIFLERPDIVAALSRFGYSPADFFDDSVYPILERPLPWLCADRLDYFLRDAIACGVLRPGRAQELLAHTVVFASTLAFDDENAARVAEARFAVMNRDWWASRTEAFIYNEFAEALRAGFRSGCLRKEDLLSDDAHVLACLRAADDPEIERRLQQIEHFRPELLEGYVAGVDPKVRWLDPPVVVGSKLMRLSELG